MVKSSYAEWKTLGTRNSWIIDHSEEETWPTVKGYWMVTVVRPKQVIY